MAENEILLQKYYFVKQQNYKDIEIAFTQMRKSENREIYCARKCVHCCIGYLIGPEIEIELIKYYLSKKESAKKKFLNNFKSWNKKISQIKDIVNEINELIKFVGAQDCDTLKIKKYFSLVNNFLNYKILCPFLDKNECMIYEVRPYVCANICSFSPPELCADLKPDRQIRKTNVPPVVTPFNGSLKFKPIIQAAAEQI